MITHGLSLGDATVLVPLDYSRIIYSAALGYLLFGELPGLWSVAGMVLIISASLYLVLTERRNAPPRRALNFRYRSKCCDQTCDRINVAFKACGFKIGPRKTGRSGCGCS